MHCDKLKAIKSARQLKQYQLADLLGIEPAHVSRLINNACQPGDSLGKLIDRIYAEQIGEQGIVTLQSKRPQIAYLEMLLNEKGDEELDELIAKLLRERKTKSGI